MFPACSISTSMSVAKAHTIWEKKKKELCKVLPLSQNLYCPYHIESSGKVKRTKGFLKLKLGEPLETLELPWPKYSH